MNAETELLKLATELFTNLSTAEEKLFRAAAKGEQANFSAASDDENDPSHADKWSAERALNVGRLTWLCTDPAASKLVTHRGIIVAGAQFNGILNLEWADITFPLNIQNCAFSESIFLSYANLRGLYLTGTHIKDLYANGAKIRDDVYLRDGFKAEGEVRLLGATIAGDLDCSRGQFINANATALNAYNVKIGGAVYLCNGFKAKGEVRLLGATIGGNLVCSCGQFVNANATAIGADGVKIGGAVFLRDGFKAEGEVRLLGATIGGYLACKGGQFVNANAITLNADVMKIRGRVDLSNVKAEGEVRLLGATIDGDLDCSGGQFVNANATALGADGVKIGGAVYLRDGFKAEGEVRLLGATIDGDLDCSRGQFINANATALNAYNVKIGGAVYLRSDFEVDGKIIFISAYVAHHFQCLNVKLPEKVILDLRSAMVGTLWDEEKSWPKAGNLFLNGFVYDEIQHLAPTDAKSRINWLKRQPDDQFLPEPYEQLAKILRKMGYENEADKVMIEKNDDIARRIAFFLGRWLQFFFKFFVGYGYRPWRAFGWSLLVIVIGTILFSSGNRVGIMTPIKDNVYVSSGGGVQQLSENYPTFNSFIYSLEKFTPLLKLEMGDYWQPNAKRSGQLMVQKFSLPIDGSVLRAYLWFHIILGWVLTTLWVGGLTGLVKK